jgi:hypothetical protein
MRAGPDEKRNEVLANKIDLREPETVGEPIPSSREYLEVEIFKTVRMSIGDPCYNVLPITPKK